MSSIAARRSRNLRWLMWLALPLAIWWLGRSLSWEDWRRLVAGMHLSQFGVLVFINAIALFFFSARWWLVLNAIGWELPYLAVLRYRVAAFAVSYFTPGSQFGGEPLQVYLLEKRHNLPRASAIASVAAEKLFELLANFGFLAVGLVLALNRSLFKGFTPVTAAFWVAALLAPPLLYFLLLSRERRPLTGLLAILPARLRAYPWLTRIMEVVAESEAQVAELMGCRPRRVAGILLVSLWFWLLALLEYWLALYVLGATLSLPQVVIALTAARLAFLTPSPGGLGALEAGQVLALQALGFNPALGIAVSLWIRVRDVLVGGLGLIWGAMLAQSRPALTPKLPIETGEGRK